MATIELYGREVIPRVPALPAAAPDAGGEQALALGRRRQRDAPSLQTI
jgi:hypothetical protein